MVKSLLKKLMECLNNFSALYGVPWVEELSCEWLQQAPVWTLVTLIKLHTAIIQRAKWNFLVISPVIYTKTLRSIILWLATE
jgi:hypothetical protein